MSLAASAIRIRNLIVVAALLLISNPSYAQSRAQQRKDSLSRISTTHYAFGPATYYLFDSLFIVDQKDFQKFRLNRTLKTMTIVQTTKDSSIVHTETGRITLINGRVSGNKRRWISLSGCRKRSVKILSASTLKTAYRIDNPKGAFEIICKD